jgi:glycerophosphoryl diester phosphodiesterase
MSDSKIGKLRVITHRGLDPSIANYFSESSFEAFEDQINRGFGGIEFDLNITKDNKIIVFHDSNFSRITNKKDNRLISELFEKEIMEISLIKGRIPTLDEVMDLIRKNSGNISAMHLKSRFQTPQTLEIIINAFKRYQDIFSKFIVFDVKPQTAKILKNHFPKLRLFPSVAHQFDIDRYNQVVGGTLITIEQAIELKKEGTIDGVWGDEWDTRGEEGANKNFYTQQNFERLHEEGLFIALVTPELHAFSPGLLGGESHSDASSHDLLMKRIAQIKLAGADFFCTDFPDEVAKLCHCEESDLV